MNYLKMYTTPPKINNQNNFLFGVIPSNVQGPVQMVQMVHGNQMWWAEFEPGPLLASKVPYPYAIFLT